MMFTHQISKNSILSLLCIFFVVFTMHATPFKKTLAAKIKNGDHNGTSTKLHKKLPDLIIKACKSNNVTKGINGCRSKSSPLHEAVMADCVLCTKALLDGGASITQSDPGHSNIAALQLAIRYGKINAWTALLQHVREKNLLADALKATDQKGRSFVHEFGRALRPKKNLSYRLADIDDELVPPKKSFEEKDVTIMQNRTKMFRELILLNKDIVLLSYNLVVHHELLDDDEFNDPTDDHYIENREEGETRLPVTVEFRFRRCITYLKQNGEKVGGTKVLDPRVVKVLKEFDSMKKMAANPNSVISNAQEKKKRIYAHARDSGAFLFPTGNVQMIQLASTPKSSGDNSQNYLADTSDKATALSQKNLIRHAKQSAINNFLTFHYRGEVEKKELQAAYLLVNQELEMFRFNAKAVLSGNVEARTDESQSFFKAACRFIPFVGKSISNAMDRMQKERKRKEIRDRCAALFSMAPNTSVFDEIMEQVILRVLVKFPYAFDKMARPNELPVAFQMKTNESVEREVMGKENACATCLLVAINKTVFNRLGDLQRETHPQKKVEMILRDLLAGQYEEPPDISAFEEDGAAHVDTQHDAMQADANNAMMQMMQMMMQKMTPDQMHQMQQNLAMLQAGQTPPQNAPTVVVVKDSRIAEVDEDSGGGCSVIKIGSSPDSNRDSSESPHEKSSESSESKTGSSPLLPPPPAEILNQSTDKGYQGPISLGNLPPPPPPEAHPILEIDC